MAISTPERGERTVVRAAVASALLLAAIVLPSAALAQPQSARRAEVRVVLATGEGGIGAMTGRVGRARPALARCDRAARALPGEPLVTVRLEVGARGRVASAAPIGPAPGHDADRWRRCVTAVLSELRFSPGRRSIVEVVVAWRFEDPADSPGVATATPPPMLAYPPHQAARYRQRIAQRAASTSQPPPAELPRDEIQRIVRDSLAPVRRCYERESAARPELAGRMLVRFVIAADGSVVAADALEDELGSDTLTTCVRYQVRRWRFPPHAGHPVTVDYPFVFRRD